MVKTLDFNATIKKFFSSVEEYLTAGAQKTKDAKERAKILENCKKIHKISQKPEYFSDYVNRINNQLDVTADGFIKSDSNDNSVFLAFAKVLHVMDEYYRSKENKWIILEEKNEKELLLAIKTWNYRTSTNVFKDFVFLFKSPLSFAVYEKNNQK